MHTESSMNNIESRVKDFEQELKRVHTTGHIVKTVQIKKYEDVGPVRGVEVLVDGRVSKNQIKQIVTYIKRSYNFDVCFYVKSHSIKVWYIDSK